MRCTSKREDDTGRCLLCALRMSAWCASKTPLFWRYRTVRAECDGSCAGMVLGSWLRTGKPDYLCSVKWL